jgi:pyruvate-formate lyase-activating enzyme
VLHVLVGRSCNNNCLFCMEADRQGRADHVGAQTRDHVRRMIVDHPDTSEILFTSGEPTLCPDLPQYVSWAKESGFRTIGLISNGRRLAYPGYLEDLVDRGLNRITVSIHGHTAKVHDGLTRAPGSFLQTRAGLARCTRLSRTLPLRVHTSTVLNRRNLPHLRALHDMLHVLGVHEMVFNVMMAKGLGAKHAAALLPHYDGVVLAFEALCAGLDTDAIRRVRVVDMPPCVLRRLPHGIGGELETFEQYEPTGSTGLSGLEVLNPASDTEQPRRARALMGRASALTARFGGSGPSAWWERGKRRATTALSRLRRGSAREGGGLDALRTGTEEAVISDLRRTVSASVLGDYYLTDRSFKDRFLRVKGPPCERCTEAARCAGVWEAYVDRFGWGGISSL